MKKNENSIVAKDKTMNSKIVYLLIEIAFVFAIPAVLSTIFGPKLDSFMGTEKIYSLLLLLLALVLSWTIVIVRYKNLAKKVRAEKEERKRLRDQAQGQKQE